MRIRLGGLVMARSVKFLGKLEATLSDQETREGWWEELRDEIKNHARTLCCTHIIGYTETCTIFGDACVLSAVGTAAVAKYLGYPTTVMSSLQDVKRASPLMTSAVKVQQNRRASRGDIDGDDRERERERDRERERERERERDRDRERERERDIAGKVYDDEDYDNEEEEVKPDEFGSGMKISRRLNSRVTANPSMGSSRIFSKSGFGGVKPSQMGSEKLSGKNLGLSGVFDSSTAQNSNYHHPNQERRRRVQRPCSYVHVPYNHNNAPFSFMRLVPCIVCRRKWVPETVLATIEPSPALAVRGTGQLLEARVCRTRKAAVGETDAVKISDLLPFVEFDVQKQLMLKMKVAGLNACFGYVCKIQVGSDMVIAMASCTAVFLEALPPSPTLHFQKTLQGRSVTGEQDNRLIKMQRDLETMFQSNKDHIESTVNPTIASAIDGEVDDKNVSNMDTTNEGEGEGGGEGGGYRVYRNTARGVPTYRRSGTALDTLQEEEVVSDREDSSSSSSSSSSSEGDDDSSLESPPSSSSSSTSSSSSSSSSEYDMDSPKEMKTSRRGSDLSAESKDDERDGEASKDNQQHKRSVRFTSDTAEVSSSKSVTDDTNPQTHSPEPMSMSNRKSGRDSQKEKEEKEKEKEERQRERMRAKDRMRGADRRPVRARRKVCTYVCFCMYVLTFIVTSVRQSPIMILFNSTQCITVQYTSLHYGWIRYDTIRYTALQHEAVKHNTIRLM